MIPVLFPVIFICVQIEAMLLFHAENVIQLEESALPLMCSRFSYSDKSAAIIYKFLHRRDNRFVNPVFAAALCRICITHINE